ncbi:hypothetical protein O3M35_003037 [Rhynocoris fuscipes]|uniref:Uncharacterized protein n=1 Tax=Rhynocoris fuscipes TaxID=488301 RepID=A0AAW1CIR9_9HEMI
MMMMDHRLNGTALEPLTVHDWNNEEFSVPGTASTTVTGSMRRTSFARITVDPDNRPRGIASGDDDDGEVAPLFSR